MISVQEASTIVFSHLGDFGTELVPLSKALNRTLAENIYTDRPFPPFDKVMMDGIAFNYNSWYNGNRNFKVEASQYAGAPQLILNNPDACVEVMTGAMLPIGADVVVPVELIEITDRYARLIADAITQYQHIHKRAQDKQQNELLLQSGITISPAEIASLATVGKSEVMVGRIPSIAIISTGDELVDVDQTPESFQIRKSNVLALEASLLESGVQADLFHLIDDRDEIMKELSRILENHDTVIMSGGVSKGKKDYVPEVLEVLGVKKLFHRVKQRPGKPFWFGVHPSGNHIFALPGNPVSTFMCYYRYIKPWLYQSLHKKKNSELAKLTHDFEFKPRLTYFLQVKVEMEKDGLVASPVQGQGSGDLANLNLADGFLELPDDKLKFLKGEEYPLIRYRY